MDFSNLILTKTKKVLKMIYIYATTANTTNHY